MRLRRKRPILTRPRSTTPKFSFEGKAVVITGAGRGLGAALALCLADEGARPILCGRDPVALTHISDLIRHRTGHTSICAQLDLTDPASISQAVAQIEAAKITLDILINNAATWLADRNDQYSEREVLEVVNSAVAGTFLLTQALLPLLCRSHHPDIVTIGSITGLPNATLQSASVPFYMAKHAQTAFAEGMRQRLAATPVRSIVVHPPYLLDVSPIEPDWALNNSRSEHGQATNRDVVDAVLFALSRPRHITTAITIHNGPDQHS